MMAELHACDDGVFVPLVWVLSKEELEYWI